MTSTSLLLTHGPIFLYQKILKLGDGFDPNMVYILDEAQEIHRRHADNIRRVLENARHAKILVAREARAPFPP